MDQDKGIKVKVGALVVFALALLAGFVVVLGDFAYSSGQRFTVEFDNAGGLKPGADVAIAGLNVGQVESLEFVRHDDPEPGEPAVGVKVHVYVEQQHADSIRENSEFYISTRSVLGEPYIEVTTPSLEADPVEEGGRVSGVSPPRVDLIAAKAVTVLDAITELIEDPDIEAGEMFAHTASLIAHLDEFIVANSGDLSETITKATDTLDEANQLMLTLNYALGEGKSLKSTFRNVQATASRARNISNQVDQRLGPMMDEAETIADNAKNVTAAADRLIADNEPKIAESIDNVHKSTGQLADMSGRAQKVVARIERGEGTVGQLLEDREMYDDMRELLRIVKRQPWKIIWKE